ncbi:MAG TPA: ribosome biogenesis GTP-binding protein YihA/YsxC [Spirochaetota bacterium]|nr:ribosome biogenesis GTP-binding protein YihA/YsxC [Spirochaetota bacterium]HPI22533.1 ribosome biogenesis GTP-binding protein YihA/YsxC [Spirochaetota bacterium]HPU90324.1 ribosome biogenesis GTP-binding protein YihA/YsxC [Spirochaetota bacterium]
MKITKAVFVKSSMNPKGYPSYDHPEIAFLGRSNVGKSSLINMLVGSASLVKVGSRPGVTTAVNFFLVNDAVSIADLPGFGYAKVPKSVKQAFVPMIRDYCAHRRNLRIAFLLIDVRRTPDDLERDIITLLSDKGIPVALTITKCDKVSKSALRTRMKEIAEALMVETDQVFPTSSKTKSGKRELLRLIGDYCLRGATSPD